MVDLPVSRLPLEDGATQRENAWPREVFEKRMVQDPVEFQRKPPAIPPQGQARSRSILALRPFRSFLPVEKRHDVPEEIPEFHQLYFDETVLCRIAEVIADG